MANGWPDQIWAPWQENADPMTGMADFKKPIMGRREYGIKKGLPKDWRKQWDTVESSSAWDVIGTSEVAGNALFAAAADAIGLDWDEWRAEAMAAIGDEADYKQEESSKLTDAQQAIAEHLPEFNSSDPQYGTDPKTGLPFSAAVKGPGDLHPNDILTHGGVKEAMEAAKDDSKEADESTEGWWGLDSRHEDIKNDLTKMQEWLIKVNKNSKSDSPLIADGPQLDDYNIEGDFDNIYEALGLTEAPEAPKELAVSYEGDYAELKTSTLKYHKPSDRYGDIQLHDDRDPDEDIKVGGTAGGTAVGETEGEGTDKVSTDVTDDRPYADYKGDGDKSDRHPERQAKVDSEWKTKRRWRHNVREIIGKDQDWKGWAKAAGVSNLNSRSDSDKIKTFYRANKDKMSFPVGDGDNVKSGGNRWSDNVQKIIGKDQDVSAWAKAAGVSNLNSRNDSNKIKTFFRKHKGVLPTK